MKVTGSGRIVLDYDMRIAEPFAIPGGEAGMDLWPAFDALDDIPLLLVRGENSDILSSASAAEMQKRQSHMAMRQHWMKPKRDRQYGLCWHKWRRRHEQSR
jgi:hypothetical protein